MKGCQFDWEIFIPVDWGGQKAEANAKILKEIPKWVLRICGTLVDQPSPSSISLLTFSS